MHNTMYRNTRVHRAKVDAPPERGKLLLEFDSGRVENAQVIIGSRQIDIPPCEVHGTVEIDLELVNEDSKGLLFEAAGAQPVMISTYRSGEIFAIICGPELRKRKEDLAAQLARAIQAALEHR